MNRFWFRTALLPTGWAHGVSVEVRDGRISAVRTGTVAEADAECHAVAVPGLANVHSHSFQRAMAGLAEVSGPSSDDFWSWREVMYSFVDRLGPEEVEAIAAWAFVEMLESGFTRVAEFHYLHHAPDGSPYSQLAELAWRVAAAAAHSGIGLTLLPVLYSYGNFGGAPAGGAQRRFMNDIERFARLLAGTREAVRGLEGALVGVAAHSLRAVAPPDLDHVALLASEGSVHIHIAEQMREVDACVAWSGRRPVEWLLDHAAVDSRWCLVHATHLSELEVRALAQSGAVAGLCPLTEADLGDGIFAAEAYLAADGAFGVGSDSNVRIDPAAELCALEYSQRLLLRRRNVLAGGPGRSTGRSLFDAALRGGAQATGMKDAGLACGCAADFLTLDAEHPALVGRTEDALLDGWLFSGGKAVIDGVWRAGHRLVSGGCHIHRDRIAGRYREVMRRLLLTTLD
ncbi:MAG TPA: formimidoylglutamate deiminase [Steroidobacteraceae bacterium]|nr:formimidoylglutamate deiminase [Steroidobacteraceae bacterium]